MFSTSRTEIDARNKLLLGIKRLKSKSLLSKNASTINIVVDSSVDRHGAFLTSLFTHLFAFPETPLMLECRPPARLTSPREPITLITAEVMHDANRRKNLTCDNLMSSHTFLKSFMLTLKKNNLEFNYQLYNESLKRRINILMEKKIVNPALNIDYLAFNYAHIVVTLFSFSHCEATLVSNIRLLLPLMAVSRCFNLLEKELDPALLKRIFTRLDCVQEPLLHAFLKYRTEDYQSPDIVGNLLALLDNKPGALLDIEGNTLWHVCRTTSELSLLKTFVPDVNAANNAGNTALHAAASDGDFDKFLFLLGERADPTLKNSEGKTPFEVVRKMDSPLYLYAKCMKKGQGIALALPPKTFVQRGQTCGLYAVSTATFYHRVTKPKLFKASLFHARKGDIEPEAHSSLREYAKEMGYTVVGELFSAASFGNLIAYNQCQSVLMRPKSYQDFIASIQTALKKDCPVIIPYSKDFKDYKAFEAHWSTIIGYCRDPISLKDMILLANYGNYELIEADKLYTAFSEIEDTFPACYLFKYENEQWQKSLREPTGCRLSKRPFPATKLIDDFKGTLVIVSPPRLQ